MKRDQQLFYDDKGNCFIDNSVHNLFVLMITIIQRIVLSNIYVCSVNFDIIKVIYLPTNSQVIVLKKSIVKFTLK